MEEISSRLHMPMAALTHSEKGTKSQLQETQGPINFEHHLLSLQKKKTQTKKKDKAAKFNFLNNV